MAHAQLVPVLEDILAPSFPLTSQLGWHILVAAGETEMGNFSKMGFLMLLQLGRISWTFAWTEYADRQTIAVAFKAFWCLMQSEGAQVQV